MTTPALPTLAALTFGLPALAWGALAAFVPVLIHLLLRQRPRRETLPTLRFLVQAHQASSSIHRLRRLLLLACRMAAILLVVGLLMKTGCAPSHSADRPSSRIPPGPASVAVVLDNSASMSYRYQNRNRLEAAVESAGELLGGRMNLPAGSQFAVVSGPTAAAPVDWLSETRAVKRQLQLVQPAWHDRSVASLLRQTYAAFSRAAHPRREVVLFTDLTETAWEEPLPDPPQELSRITIVDVGQDESRNLALSLLEAPRHFIPAGVASSVSLKIRAGNNPHEALLTLFIDGEPRDRRRLDGLAADSETFLPFTLPPLAKGIHRLRAELEPSDALAGDNQRFAYVAVDEVPEVLVVGDTHPDSVAALVAAMIAPPAQPQEEQRFRLRRVPPDAGALPLSPAPLAVLLVDVPELGATHWGSLGRYVSEGGTLLVVPGPNSRPAASVEATDLLPAPVESIGNVHPPLTLAAADLTQPFLRPFNDPEIDSINNRLVYRRLVFGAPPADTTTVAPFSDHAPAILQRSSGQGQVVMLAFSPHRDWSQFGTQAGPMIVLLHTILEAVSPEVETITALTAGHADPLAGREGTRQVTPQETMEGSPSPRADTDQPLTAVPGLYHVHGSQDSTPSHYYSVNIAEDESQPVRISPEKITAQFPEGSSRVIRRWEELDEAGSTAGGRVDWTVPLALLLLGLLWAESALGNRLYGSVKTAGQAAPVPADGLATASTSR